MNSRLENKIMNAPKTSGVYLMKNREDEVIYVGKAKNLRSRVRAYFGGTDSRFMVPFLISRIHDIEFIVTDTEKEALILENTLIKAHHPRYNVDFRDDKAYFHVRINPAESFPRFQLVRRPKRDHARYFGPYPSSAAAKETLRLLQPIFPLRTCRDRELQSRKRPCIEYEIKRCTAPCVGLIDDQSYGCLVRDSIAFLEGQGKALLSDLRARMNSASQELNFEEAAVLRDRIAAVEETLAKQRVIFLSERDTDAFGLYREGDLTQVCTFFVRKGKLIGQRTFPLLRIGGDSSDILSSLVKRYYDGDLFIPDEIIVPARMEDRHVIEEWLGEKKGKRVTVSATLRGRARDLVNMACRNAETVFTSERVHETQPWEAILLMEEKLDLKTAPTRIECFDISNVGGRHAVGSLVTFVDGLPWKAGYRRFRIKSVAGADDYAMLYEVLRRRYERKENLPGLIVVDGGKGHVGVAVSVLRELGISGVDIIGLAKEKNDLPPGKEPPRSGHRRDSFKGEDRVYLPQKKEPLYVSRWPAVLFLLQRIRNEAHRFAHSYYRKLKEKEDFQSSLDGISGIGDKRKRDLLAFFGDIREIRRASLEDLRKVEGIGPRKAELIHDYLQRMT